MKLGRLKRDFNWNYGIEFGKSVPWKTGFNPYWYVWCFKFHKLPNEGDVAVEGKNYRGLGWRYDIFAHWNIIMRRKTFKIRNRFYHIDWPIGIKHYK